MPDNDIKENKELIENKESEEVAEDDLIEENHEEAKAYDAVIEDARQGLFNAYSKTKRINNIIMIAMVIAICGIMFLVISNDNTLRIIGYSLLGALVLGLILYYVLTRKNLPNKIKEYVPFVMKTLNERMFSNQNFSDIASNEEEKLAMDDLIGDGIYAEANNINSRNVVRGTYRGHHFLYAEAALMRPSSRKQQVPPLFVGRYISIPNDLKFDGRFVITLKNPKQPLDLPNAISDLTILEDKDEFTLYGPEGSNYKSALNSKAVNYFRRLKIEGHLLNANIVFWGGHTAVYLSYDDAILSVPFDKKFDKDAFEKALDDLLICFNAMTEE